MDADNGDKKGKTSGVEGQNNTDLPKIPLENSTSKGTLWENSSNFSHLSQAPGELPDCPVCHKWDWTFNGEGQAVCSCGNISDEIII